MGLPRTVRQQPTFVFWRETFSSTFSSGAKMSRALACADQRLMASPLRQTSHSAGHWRFLPPFSFCGCWCNFFSPPLCLRLFLLLWATEVVCCPLGLQLLRKNRARRSRSRKKACESVFGAALSLRSRSCRRVFCCTASGAVDFLLSSSYFLGGSLEPGLPRTVGFMAGLTATFRAAWREFWLFDDRSELCHCGEVRRRLCLSVQGVLEVLFATFSSDSLLGALSLACIGVVALAWMCRVTPPRYFMSDFLACGKFSPVR